jgi:hypothetical protein
MKISLPILLISILCMAVSSCTSIQSPVQATSTPRPRPLSEYDMGIWHSEIATQMTEKGSTILNNLGEGGVEFEIEILPASSLQDEVIIVKYGNWPESVDLGQVWYWLLLTIKTESERNKLDPQAVIATEFSTKPYGEFVSENNNLIGFCEIPWDSITTYTSSGGQDVSAVKVFLDTWQCTYR